MDALIQIILLVPISIYITTKNWWTEKHLENGWWDEFWEVLDDYLLVGIE